MDAPPRKEQRTQELSRQACTHAEQLVKAALGQDVLAEVLDQQWPWTELRVLFTQHMRVWQDLTRATLTLDPAGQRLGWLVEKRKDACGPQILTDAEVEKCARTLPQIRPEQKLAGIVRTALDDKRSLAVARFVGRDPAASVEVSVNHTTGEVIGLLPTPVGQPTPLPTDDAEAKAAEQLAWKEVEDDLRKRVGPDVAQQARDVLKLTPVAAVHDETGRRVYAYRLWRFFTTCDVSIEETTNEIVAWYIEAFQAEAPERRITETEAAALARSELKAPGGFHGPSASFGKTGEDEKITVHWWHEEHGINVEGDQTTVLLNATTGRIFSVSRKWRWIPPDLLKPPAITSEQALRAADQAIKRDPAQPRGKVIGQNLIQVASDPDHPSPVRDVLVWRVGYAEAGGIGFTEVSINCQTGEAVRITGW